MDWKRPALLLLLLPALGACGASPEEENLQSQKEDYFERATIYYNSGRYTQAYQQARRGLEIEPDHGGLNLVAGRALLLHRDLTEVSHALHYLEVAQEELQNYKADFAMAEWHFRYGSMLLGVAEESKASSLKYPDEDEKIQTQQLAGFEEQKSKAKMHFYSADTLLDSVLLSTPEDLNALEMSGQVNALLGNTAEALLPLQKAIELLQASRKYNNRLLLTDARLAISQEEYVRRVLNGDIKREVAIHFLVAGLHQKNEAFQAEEFEYTTILGLVPNSAPALHSRALCRYERGRLSEAAKDMREFIAITDLEFDAAQVQKALDIISESDALQAKRE
jgi:tetratricopeptide (TPR) repeat protein